jgi:hypothetical protein
MYPLLQQKKKKKKKKKKGVSSHKHKQKLLYIMHTAKGQCTTTTALKRSFRTARPHALFKNGIPRFQTARDTVH